LKIAVASANTGEKIHGQGRRGAVGGAPQAACRQSFIIAFKVG